MKTVTLSHDYDFPPEDVWFVATDLDCLKVAVEGVIAFRGLPGGQIYKGQDITVDVSLFGRLPYQPYRMRVVECDATVFRFRSDEVGAGVRSWRHHLWIEVTQTGCNLHEEIEIDAGLLTPLFRAWARFLYKRRHEPRLRMLARLAAERAD